MQIALNRKKTVASFFFAAALFCTIFVSCKDDDLYADREPDFLGESIYAYMEQDGNFKYFLRLINDLGYQETLSKTGSKTLFPARDDAFERFFQQGTYGASSYEGLSPAQKREIMNVSMVNMAYLSYMLSNVSRSGDNSGEGLAIRRNTTSTFLDSVAFVRDEVLFDNSYWNQFKSKGLYLLDDETSRSIVHFTPENMLTKHILPSDFELIHNGTPYENAAVYINGIKVAQKDIICKNGYIHVMEDVLLPAKNMAKIINENGETALFCKLMDKFSLPYYNESVSDAVHVFYNGSTPDRPLIPSSDSVFIKRYFTDDFQTDITGKPLANYGLLHFDPARNSDMGGGVYQDMRVMFAPTDAAMNAYINSDEGRYLKDAYGTWDNVPTSLLALFIKNHQKKSFTNTLPQAWDKLTDESSFSMPVDRNKITKTYIGGNGTVHISSVVFPPIDYQCVYASTLTNDVVSVMRKGIQDTNMRFYLYLRSMENMYNLLVPTDEAMKNYKDPISWAIGGEARRIWSFRYVPERDLIFAEVYTVDEEGNKAVRVTEYNTGSNHQNIILNRLRDIIDMHIVVGHKALSGEMSGYIDDGSVQYVRTKSGATIKIEGSGENTGMIGGGDLETQSPSVGIEPNTIAGGKYIYDSNNGRTFFIDGIIQDPFKSVYTIMGEKPEYTTFFELLKGHDQVFSYFSRDNDVVPVFDLKSTTSSSGLGYVVNSFNNFRYTVFIPTQAALEEAFLNDEKLFSWEEIADEEDYDKKKEMTLYLLRFLKYHFMDNSVYIDGNTYNNYVYETAARNPTGKFHKVTVNSNGTDLTIRNEAGLISANVIKTGGLYNIMARDYIVNNRNYNSATMIEASSRSVIHLIDKALKVE